MSSKMMEVVVKYGRLIGLNEMELFRYIHIAPYKDYLRRLYKQMRTQGKRKTSENFFSGRKKTKNFFGGERTSTREGYGTPVSGPRPRDDLNFSGLQKKKKHLGIRDTPHVEDYFSFRLSRKLRPHPPSTFVHLVTQSSKMKSDYNLLFEFSSSDLYLIGTIKRYT